MAREYAQRMGRPLTAAPVWLSFDYDKTVSAQSVWGRETIEQVITVEIPTHEVLFAMHEPWMSNVLEGWCLDEPVPPLKMRFSCPHAGKERRESWAGIFDLGNDPMCWQGVTDRIEPEWLRAVNGESVRRMSASDSARSASGHTSNLTPRLPNGGPSSELSR